MATMLRIVCLPACCLLLTLTVGAVFFFFTNFSCTINCTIKTKKNKKMQFAALVSPSAAR